MINYGGYSDNENQYCPVYSLEIKDRNCFDDYNGNLKINPEDIELIYGNTNIRRGWSETVCIEIFDIYLNNHVIKE